MDGSRIEVLLALASAKSSRAHQRITTGLDFTVCGMKTEREIREFLFEVEFARNELVEAAANLAAIQELYSRAKPEGKSE